MQGAPSDLQIPSLTCNATQSQVQESWGKSRQAYVNFG